MNLISHFTTATPLPAAGRLGSVLPDLLRMVGRRPRPKALVEQWEREPVLPPAMAELVVGVRFHHHVDSCFHAAPLFTENMSALRRAMERAGGPPGLKRFFAAHLLLEIFFDHLLLADNPGVSDAFHSLLEQESALAVRFAAMHPGTADGAVEVLLQRVVADRFVDDYHTPVGMFYRANRILQRLQQRPLNGAEMEAVTLYFSEEAPALHPALLQFVRSMQKWAEAGVAGEPPRSATSGPGREKSAALSLG